MTRDEAGLLECVLAALIRRSGGSIILKRAELDAAVEASATAEGRSEWQFEYDPNLDGSEVAIRAIAAPVSTMPRPESAAIPVGGIEVPPDRFAGVVLAALIDQDGGWIEVDAASYRQMALLAQADRQMTIRPVLGLDGPRGDHFLVHLVDLPNDQAGAGTTR